MPGKILKKLGIDKKKTEAKRQQQKRRLSIKIQTMIILNILALAGLGLYSYQNYLQYDLLHKVQAKNEQTISTLESSLTEVQNKVKTEKEAFKSQRSAVLKDLAVIFPDSESYTELTRQLDSFFFNLNSTNPPILHNNLRFEEPQLSEDGSYYILPFSMSIQSSRENFNRFLEYVGSSGSIGSNVRLMSIQSIQINFIQQSQNNINEFDIRFTVNMHAYFQNTNPENA